MSNIYKHIKGELFREHKEAFTVLLAVFNAFSLRYFLIGAQARDIHFLQQGIKPARGTRDIDFAVMVHSMEYYKALKNSLIENGFERSSDPYRLNWDKGKTVIDLLPFGKVEQNYTVHFLEREIELSVLGYSELNEELENFYLNEDESVSIPVPPLHGIFILKLLSWDAKKPGREKDLIDLNLILENYWSFVENEVYDKHLDLIDDDFEMGKAAARVLGRHLKVTLNKSEVLQRQIRRILEEQTEEVGLVGVMLQKFASESRKTVEEVRFLLGEVIKGIDE